MKLDPNNETAPKDDAKIVLLEVKDKDHKPITQKEINDAIHLLKKARNEKQKKANKSEDKDFYINKGLYKENFI